MFCVEVKSGITGVDGTLDRMQVYGQGFSIPDRTVQYEDLQYRAYKIPVATTLEMTQDHNVTLYNDVRGDLRRAFLDWQAATINPDIHSGSYFESNRRPTRLGPGDNTEPTITIYMLAPDYKTYTEKIVLHGVRINKVGAVEMSNTAGGISTFQVDFKSVYWENLPGNGANPTHSGRQGPNAGSIGVNNWDNGRNSQLGSTYMDETGTATSDALARNHSLGTQGTTPSNA